MAVHQEIIPEQVGGLDYSDELASGFRFTPTDAELIVDYLKAKMESRDHPKCRLHEVNIYNHSPDQLAEGYRSHDNVWYYLTPRDRKYPKGNRPDRAVGGFGFWKATQKHKDVYDDKTGEMVGHKTSLAFYITKDEEKTKWLMHEYTTIEPNLPPYFKSGGQITNNNNKLNEWVLCKIYYKKKKKEQTHDVIMTTTTPNIKKKKVKKVTQEPKRTRVPKRRRVSAEENHRAPQQEDTNNPLHTDLDTHHLQQHQAQMDPTPMLQQGHDEGSSVVYNNIINIDDGETQMNYYSSHSPYEYDPITMQPPAFQSSIQPPQSQCYQLNHHFTSNAIASNHCQISEPPAANSSPQPQPQPLDGHYTMPAAANEHGLNPESNHIHDDQNYMLPSTYSECEARLLSDDDDDIFIPDEVFQSQFEDFAQELQNQSNISIANSSPQPQPQPQPLDDHYTTPAATEHGLIPESNHIYDDDHMLPSTYSACQASRLSDDDDDDFFPDEVYQRWCKDDALLTTLQDLRDLPNIDFPTYYGLADHHPDASAYDDPTISSAHPPVNVVEEEDWNYDIVEQHCAD